MIADRLLPDSVKGLALSSKYVGPHGRPSCGKCNEVHGPSSPMGTPRGDGGERIDSP